MALAAAYTADVEFMAQAVCDMLLQYGLGAMIRSFSVSGYNFAMPFSGGAWGEVLVEERDLERARELVGGFLGSLGELEEA
jgi:hypothetical protein